MELSQFIIMKHELLLTIIALVLLVAEIALDNKKKVIPLAISLFGFYTVLGFFGNQNGVELSLHFTL